MRRAYHDFQTFEFPWNRKLVLPPREQLTISVSPEFAFRGEKIIAWESKPRATEIVGFYVDKVSQFPPVLTSVLAANSLSDCCKLKVCEAGKSIAFVVKNLTDETVEWCASVVGRKGISSGVGEEIKAQPHKIEFGPLLGAAGETRTVTVRPRCVFRANHFSSTDSLHGAGSKIRQILIGGRKLVDPIDHDQILKFFYIATDYEDYRVSITVEFFKQCEFSAVVYGRAVLSKASDVVADDPCPSCSCYLRREFKCGCGETHFDYCTNCGRNAALPPTEHVELSPIDVRCGMGPIAHEHTAEEKANRIDKYFTAALKKRSRNTEESKS